MEGCEAEGVEEAMKKVKKVALMALGIAISALLYTEVGLMITFALLVCALCSSRTEPAKKR